MGAGYEKPAALHRLQEKFLGFTTGPWSSPRVESGRRLIDSTSKPESQLRVLMLAPMPNQIHYAHHEMDPVLLRGNEALIFIHGHWQSMNCALAFSEAMLMTEEEFYNAFGKIADHLPADAWTA
jgi:hypothetical protein